MDNTVTRIERRPDGSYILTVNGKIYECKDTEALLRALSKPTQGRDKP